MKIVSISDTHNFHKNLELPKGDILIHCGDFTSQGFLHEIEKFMNWFSSQDFKYKILIAGNHEKTLCPRLNIHPAYNKNTIRRCQLEVRKWPGVTYLEESFVIIDEMKIFGSPYSGKTEFSCGWGFEANEKTWDKIPDDTDILITHGPPKGILDTVSYPHTKESISLGCSNLLKRVNDVKPVYHLFGHIHDSYGEFTSEHTMFKNCANMNEDYKIVNKPVVFDI